MLPALQETRHARTCGAPLLFTAPTWPPVLHGPLATLAPDAVPGGESPELNPFRSPLLESLHHCAVPYVSNGWLLCSRLRLARKANRRATMASRVRGCRGTRHSPLMHSEGRSSSDAT